METIFNKIIDSDIERNNNECKIVSIEGIDGSGKTTSVDLCVDKLQKLGYRATHFYTSSNYNVYWNTVEVLQQKELIDAGTNQILHNLAFLTYLRTEFVKLLNENDYVISEWYIYGKLVLSELYENGPKSKSLIESYMQDNKLIMPDHSFFLDLPIHVAHERILNRKGRLESKESMEMLVKAHSLWDKYIKKFGIEKIDATKEPDEVADTIVKKLVLHKPGFNNNVFK